MVLDSVDLLATRFDVPCHGERDQVPVPPCCRYHYHRCMVGYTRGQSWGIRTRDRQNREKEIFRLKKRNKTCTQNIPSYENTTQYRAAIELLRPDKVLLDKQSAPAASSRFSAHCSQPASSIVYAPNGRTRPCLS